MKALHISLIAGVLAAVAGTAMASSGSLVEFKPLVLPVVVQVNAQGNVTDILPAVQISPRFRNLLVRQLDEWITSPALLRGHPVASRFIAEVAMRAKQRKDGMYDASFVYVKGLPMPFGGAVHWNVIDGGLQYTLVSDAAARASRTASEMMTFQEFRRPFAPSERPSSSPSSIRPATQSVSPVPLPSSPPPPSAGGGNSRAPGAPGTPIR